MYSSFRAPSISAPASPMLSPSTFLAALPLRRPKLPHRGSSSSSDVNPHTPVDQMIHTPLNPPEAPRAPPPQSKRQSLWNDHWQLEAQELYTPLFQGELVKSDSSSGSSAATTTLNTLGSSHTPLEPISAINPVVHQRLNPRAARPFALPRRLSYGLTKQAPRKLSDSSSHDGASSPLSPMPSPAIASSPTLPWPNVDAPARQERGLASPLIIHSWGCSAPSTPAVLSDAPAQAHMSSYFNLRMPG